METQATATANEGPVKGFKRDASWPSVLFFIHLHILGLYGIFVMFTSASWLTIVFSMLWFLKGVLVLYVNFIILWNFISTYMEIALTLTVLGILGATAGAHRLWAHGTYKATNGLRIFLMLCQTIAGQVSYSVTKLYW